MKRTIAFHLALLAASCGYSPAYSGDRPQARLTVSAARHRVPNADAVQLVMAGVREELSRGGVLAPGRGHPTVVVEVLRVDEAPSGIAVGAGDQPTARGATVAVTARAWVIEQPGGEPTRDSGDVRRVEHVASDLQVAIDSAVIDAAIRAAARRAGQALGRRILGVAEPGVEPL